MNVPFGPTTVPLSIHTGHQPIQQACLQLKMEEQIQAYCKDH